MTLDEATEKAGLLEDFLEQLERVGTVSLEEYLDSEIRQLAAERSILKIVECATDLNNYVAYRARAKVPSSYYDSFVKLDTLGIIRTSVAKQLASIAGLRNRIVHEYADVDNEIVYNNIARIGRLYPVYLAGIRSRLAELANESDLEE